MPSEEDLTKREPINIISDPYASAPELLKRLVTKAKDNQKEKRKPPKRSKPRLIVDNDKPDPPDKQ